MLWGGALASVILQRGLGDIMQQDNCGLKRKWG